MNQAHKQLNIPEQIVEHTPSLSYRRILAPQSRDVEGAETRWKSMKLRSLYILTSVSSRAASFSLLICKKSLMTCFTWMCNFRLVRCSIVWCGLFWFIFRSPTAKVKYDYQNQNAKDWNNNWCSEFSFRKTLAIVFCRSRRTNKAIRTRDAKKLAVKTEIVGICPFRTRNRIGTLRRTIWTSRADNRE